MSKSKSEILDEISAFIAKHGGKTKDWCFGTSGTPREKLREHNFKNGDVGLIRQAHSELQAGEVVEFLTGQGARGGADIKPGYDYVYGYKRAAHTKP
jgi:hypothetical protein